MELKVWIRMVCTNETIHTQQLELFVNTSYYEGGRSNTNGRLAIGLNDNAEQEEGVPEMSLAGLRGGTRPE